MKVSKLQRGARTWRLRLDAGRQVQPQYSYRTVHGTEAEAEAARVAWELEHTVRGPAPLRSTVTLPRLIEHLIRHGDFSEKTRAEYRGLLARYIAEQGTPEDAQSPYRNTLPITQLRRLTVADGEAYKSWLLDRLLHAGNPRSTLFQTFRLVRWALEKAARQGIIPVNPFRHIELPKWMPVERTIPDARQMQTLINAADEGSLGTLVRLAVWTGARRGELLALTWRQVDLDQGCIIITRAAKQIGAGPITFGPPKTRTGRRTVALPHEAVAYLRSRRTAAGRVALQWGKRLEDLPVLPTPEPAGDEPWSPMDYWRPDSASQAARRFIRETLGYEAELEGGGIHSLRHSHATTLMRAKVSARTVQARLGHADITTTLRIYSHTNGADDEAAADALSGALNRNRA